MSGTQELRELARRHGVLASYRDARGHDVTTPDESLLAVLKALEAPVDGMRDVRDALAEARRAWWTRGMEPVVVQWDDGPAWLDLRLREGAAEGTLRVVVLTEGDGGLLEHDSDLSAHAASERVEADGQAWLRKRVPLGMRAPHGRHRLSATVGVERHEAWLVAAPSTAHPVARRAWGVFAPLHGLRSATSLGAGHLGDLACVLELVGSRGGSFVGTLPLHAAFLDDPCEPSPYSPVSRLFWNELFLDVARVPDVGGSRRCSALAGSPETRAAIERLRAARLTEPREQFLLQRRLVECASESLRPDREAALEAYVRQRPDATDYALFRGACERLGVPWTRWEVRERNGDLRPSDADAAAVRYHLVAQWLMEEQLSECASREGAGLYLDMPLGVHPDGYDAWRHRSAFGAASAGAPPDAFFTKGQDWGLRPLHPERAREQGHAYFAECLARPMGHAAQLRLDHVMALHRVFWVPEGFSPKEGAYVRYPEEELLAVACLESRRHGCALVGENLGTVPDEVEEALRRHGIGRMHVVQYAMDARTGDLRDPAPDEVSSVNTHDMPTFAAFVGGADVDLRVELGLLDADDAERERKDRARAVEGLARDLERTGDLARGERGAGAIHEALLGRLGRSEAAAVMVNLEDLWLEEEPVNVPGTGSERPNWRRRLRHPIEELAGLPEVASGLDRLAQARRTTS